jgi:uncharacterized membrane protein
VWEAFNDLGECCHEAGRLPLTRRCSAQELSESDRTAAVAAGTIALCASTPSTASSFHVAWIVLWMGLGIFGHLPFLGWASLPLWPLIGLADFVIWLILVFKDYQGQMFKLPVIGDMAVKQANTV